MPIGEQKLVDAILTLPLESRSEISDLLLASLRLPDSNIENEWLSESRRRYEAYERGEVSAEPAEAVFQRLCSI